MKKSNLICVFYVLLFECVLLFEGGLFAQNASAPSVTVPSSAASSMQKADLPLKKASLFSSGVGYFEHQGGIPPNASVVLPFNTNAVNDALKSLVINDPQAANPQVNYLSENSLRRTLKSLKIDLSDNPTLADILRSLKGAEIDIIGGNGTSISGRIASVENSFSVGRNGESVHNSAVSISNASGLSLINVNEIKSFNFRDAAISEDLTKALNLLEQSRDAQTKHLQVDLAGRDKRNVSISYVIPTPVWKVSYRLDLNASKPFLQGWAIIDNDGDTDWVNVELSLVTGRPVSFVQQLYQPYYTRRPTLPLSIAGIADAMSYDSGYIDDVRDYARSEREAGNQLFDARETAQSSAIKSKSMSSQRAPASMAPGVMADNIDHYVYSGEAQAVAGGVSGGVIESMAGANAGDQFEFTLKKPVTLARQQSAMLPLVEGSVNAEKTLVFSGQKASPGVTIHPAISALLTNNTGMKLPAGPITVFDGGTYAGDALIEFVPENEKRIISYGDDLSVSGTKSYNYKSEVTTVNVQKGVMTINRKDISEHTYTVRNVSGQSKKMIIEHPITAGMTLSEPKKAGEQTAKVYRFDQNLKANDLIKFSVKEERPSSQTVVLANIPLDSFVYYSTSTEIPANVRTALEKAVKLKRQAQAEQKTLQDIQTEYKRLTDEQDRIRKNIEAVGNTSAKGGEYMQRLAEQDAQIDTLSERIQTQRTIAGDAQKAYDDYVGTLRL
ncbi:MAG: DUF4139 domain-containing protein [Termitinemataceae bacterium]|nr:MAG: DUF4139 domain-containing protein [Termitinemataceae bacterium]